MTPPPAEDPFDKVERMLGEQQMRHFELAGMVGEYRQMLSDLRERHDEDAAKLARSLPGARYYVQNEHVRQTWLALEAELKKLFPRAD